MRNSTRKRSIHSRDLDFMTLLGKLGLASNLIQFTGYANTWARKMYKRWAHSTGKNNISFELVFPTLFYFSLSATHGAHQRRALNYGCTHAHPCPLFVDSELNNEDLPRHFLVIKGKRVILPDERVAMIQEPTTTRFYRSSLSTPSK